MKNVAIRAATLRAWRQAIWQCRALGGLPENLWRAKNIAENEPAEHLVQRLTEDAY